MPTIQRRGKRWRVQVRRLGHPPLSKTFGTRGEAWEWGVRAEREVVTGQFHPAKHTLREAFDKYAAEVSPKKRGGRWERYRLAADAFQKAPIASRGVGLLTAADVAAWRDARLRDVSGATVRREMNLLESVLEIARKEWKWLPANPMRDVAKPANPRSRRRRVKDSEIAIMVERLTGPSGKEVAIGFQLGVETGMRAGEMWTLERPQIDLKRRVVHLLKTKNGDEREVALSPKATSLMAALLNDGRPKLFTCTNAVRDTLFRKARDAAEIHNLHFHDSRSEAIYRLSKKLDVLELARQIGHRDIKSLMFYYQADAAELAKKLAGPSRNPIHPPPTNAGRKTPRKS